MGTREAVIGANVHIICSDEARNGKTIFARLYADLLRLRTGNPARVIDTDYPHGTIIRYFPREGEIIDISRTAGQVRLFDRILENPNLDHVIDLEAHHLDRFFSIFADIGYDQAVAEAHIGLAVFFVLDRTLASIEAAIAVREHLASGQFVLVRNDAIGAHRMPAFSERELAQIGMDRRIVLPALSSEALDIVEDPAFNFTDFIIQREQTLPGWLTEELWGFLEKIYEQQPPSTSEHSFAI